MSDHERLASQESAGITRRASSAGRGDRVGKAKTQSPRRWNVRARRTKRTVIDQYKAFEPHQQSPALLINKDGNAWWDFLQQVGRRGRPGGRPAIAVLLNREDSSVVRYDTGDKRVRTRSALFAIRRILYRVRGKRYSRLIRDCDPHVYSTADWRWGAYHGMSEAQAITLAAEIQAFLPGILVPDEQAA